MRETKRGSSDPYYDIIEDFDLIVSSFLSQYGLRIYSSDFDSVNWDEFAALLAGLDHKSALGRIVMIRAETDKDVIKNFTKEQRRIWSDWRARRAGSVSAKDVMSFCEDMKKAFMNIGNVQKAGDKKDV